MSQLLVIRKKMYVVIKWFFLTFKVKYIRRFDFIKHLTAAINIKLKQLSLLLKKWLSYQFFACQEM